MKDRNGNTVDINCLVKVLSLDTGDFTYLGEKELSEIMSIIGETLEVYEIDEYGQAWITKEWWLSDNDVISHSIGLSSHEFEVVSSKSHS